MTRIAEHAAGDASLSAASKCACAAKATGTCGCAKKPEPPLRAFGATPGRAAATDAHAVRSRLGDGQALPSGVRSRMEGALGHDFSRVRVHADGAAQRAAGELGARAFAVGNDVAFGSGDWRPGTPVGDAILAHELAHVAQQSGGTGTASETALEHDADVAATGAVTSFYGAGTATRPARQSGLRLQRCGGGSQGGAKAPGVPKAAAGETFSCPGGKSEAARQAEGSKAELDKQGQAVIDAAKAGEAKDVGVGLVSTIICTYFPDRAHLVKRVVFKADLSPRLQVDYHGSGAKAQGTIVVGNRFVDDVKAGNLARSVLAVDHELFHIQQIRDETPQKGLVGSDKSDEREFLAYYRTATSQPLAGTGRYRPGQRFAAARGALGYYNCLDSTKQTTYKPMRDQLVVLYDKLKSSVKDPEPIPTACVSDSNG